LRQVHKSTQMQCNEHLAKDDLAHTIMVEPWDLPMVMVVV